MEGFKNSYDNYVIYAKEKPLSAAAQKFLEVIRRRNGKARHNIESPQTTQ